MRKKVKKLKISAKSAVILETESPLEDCDVDGFAHLSNDGNKIDKISK